MIIIRGFKTQGSTLDTHEGDNFIKFLCVGTIRKKKRQSIGVKPIRRAVCIHTCIHTYIIYRIPEYLSSELQLLSLSQHKSRIHARFSHFTALVYHSVDWYPSNSSLDLQIRYDNYLELQIRYHRLQNGTHLDTCLIVSSILKLQIRYYRLPHGYSSISMNIFPEILNTETKHTPRDTKYQNFKYDTIPHHIYTPPKNNQSYQNFPQFQFQFQFQFQSQSQSSSP